MITPDDPVAFVAEQLGITPEEVLAMTPDDIERVRIAIRAEKDQLEAELRDLRIRIARELS